MWGIATIHDRRYCRGFVYPAYLPIASDRSDGENCLCKFHFSEEKSGFVCLKYVTVFVFLGNLLNKLAELGWHLVKADKP